MTTKLSAISEKLKTVEYHLYVLHARVESDLLYIFIADVHYRRLFMPIFSHF